MKAAVLTGFALVLAGCAAERPFSRSMLFPPPVPLASAPVVEGPAPPRITPDAPFRDAPPPAGPLAPFVAPKIAEMHLANGVRVLLLPRHDVPIVSLRVVTTVGAGDLRAALPGGASMMGAMLEQGTRARSAAEVADAYEALGARHGTWVDWDWAGVAVKVTSDNLDAAVAVLADVVMHPTFPPEELDRLRARRLAGLSQERDSPVAMAANAVAATLYGGAHAYGHSITGGPSDVAKATRDDLVRLHAALFSPKTCAIVVAGDVMREALGRKLEAAFGGWASPAPAAPPLTGVLPGPGKGGARLVMVDRPGAEEAVVRLAEVGVIAGAPDRDAVAVMNAILGGMAASRMRLHVKGAVSRFDGRHGRGPFVASATATADRTVTTVSELMKEVHKMQDGLVTPAELSRAKESLELALPGRFETVDAATQTLTEVSAYRLPLDEYATLPARMEKVTAAEVQRAARAHLAPDALHVVVVGDRSRLESALSSLKLGPIEARDAFGDLVPHGGRP